MDAASIPEVLIVEVCAYNDLVDGVSAQTQTPATSWLQQSHSARTLRRIHGWLRGREDNKEAAAGKTLQDADKLFKKAWRKTSGPDTVPDKLSYLLDMALWLRPDYSVQLGQRITRSKETSLDAAEESLDQKYAEVRHLQDELESWHRPLSTTCTECSTDWSELCAKLGEFRDQLERVDSDLLEASQSAGSVASAYMTEIERSLQVLKTRKLW